MYANNSDIPITEIGTISNTGIQCITDRMPCCASLEGTAGQWLFPDGTAVHAPSQNIAATFYQNRGNNGTVNLNRVNIDITSPVGKFCCMVQNYLDQMQQTCAIVGRFNT